MLMFVLAILLTDIAMVLWYITSEDEKGKIEPWPLMSLDLMRVGCIALLGLSFWMLYKLFGTGIGLLAWLVLQVLAYYVLTNYTTRTEVIRWVRPLLNKLT